MDNFEIYFRPKIASKVAHSKSESVTKMTFGMNNFESC